MELKDVLHFYLGCQAIYSTSDEPGEAQITLNTGELQNFYDDPDEVCIRPILRKLSSMTEEEMIDVLVSQVPEDMEDKPTRDDYDLELYYNDNATMVDGDVAIGAEYTCSCYIGQISFLNDGRAIFSDENGEFAREGLTPKSFHYLLSKHFDLFGLIESKQAIDINDKTEKQ